MCDGQWSMVNGPVMRQRHEERPDPIPSWITVRERNARHGSAMFGLPPFWFLVVLSSGYHIASVGIIIIIFFFNHYHDNVWEIVCRPEGGWRPFSQRQQRLRVGVGRVRSC